MGQARKSRAMDGVGEGEMRTVGLLMLRRELEALPPRLEVAFVRGRRGVVDVDGRRGGSVCVGGCRRHGGRYRVDGRDEEEQVG